MDDSCAVCAESLEWVAYGSCGHRDVCSTCVARLRFICDDRRCCICKTESDIIFVTKALGDYTRTISDFLVFPRDATEGRNGSYWYHEDTGAYFDDSDHYKMIKAMCRLSCSVCDKEDQAGGNDGPKRRGKFRNVEQLKSHLYHRHRLFMCSLCLEGRKIFICEQKLYTRSQLNRHINSGDSEVDGNESERGGFMGHPVCEFCKKPFYGDNELYSHMSTEHYTCHICQRQNPGQYEYYKDYNDLEIHFRQQHFLCEDEACLAKKFVVFSSESEMKRHNAIEHGGHMSRSKRNAVLQIPTSFRYRRGSEQDHRRGRRRGLQFVSSDAQLASVIDASLETANATQSAPDHIETSTVDEIVAPFEMLATADTEGSSRYRQALSGGARNVQLQESSFPPLPMVPTSSQQKPKYDSDGLSQNTMAARLRGRKNGTVNVLNSAHAWPSTSQGDSSSSSGFPWSKPTGNGLVSTSNSVISSQTRPATSSGSTSSSYASTAQTRTVRDNGFISGNTSSHQWNLSDTNRVSHSASAPNLIERGSSDSSTSDFPPIFAKKNSVPTPGQSLSMVEDVHTANKSLVETIRSALEFDEDKYTAFKDISAEYRQGMINAAEYLSYVEQFGLSHLVIELARLCPDAQKQRELIETYNISLKFRSGGENDSSNIMVHKKANKTSKKGKGKVVETTDGKSKDALTDNVMNTVRKLQASYRPSEEEVEVLSKDGYRASKGKSQISVDEQQELGSVNGGGLGKSTRQSDSQATGISSNQNPGGSSGGKQRKKTSKFHRVRLGDGSVATLLDLRQSDPDLEHEEDSAIEKQNPSESFPIRGAWRNGGGQKLVALTQRDTTAK